MRHIFTLLVICLLFAVSGFSQTQKYFSTGSEMIFSLAAIEDNGNSENSILRWSPVFNSQSFYNIDFSANAGIFVGLGFRNVGFIYGNYKLYPAAVSRSMQVEGYTTQKKKFRSYNLGIPVGFKIGKLNKMFFYGGYEIEFPFHYKEKTFDSDDKKTDKLTEWFSNRQEPIQHGFLVGIEFPHGIDLTFKYYLSNFHNQEFTDNNGFKPYQGLKSNVFYFSINSKMFKDVKKKMHPKDKTT